MRPAGLGILGEVEAEKEMPQHVAAVWPPTVEAIGAAACSPIRFDPNGYRCQQILQITPNWIAINSHDPIFYILAPFNL